MEEPQESELSSFLLNLSSCDFVGDSGCCDPECWRCHSPLRPENLRTLAKNLALAAALCHSYALRDERPAWRPGCNIDQSPSQLVHVAAAPYEDMILCRDHLGQLAGGTLPAHEGLSAEQVAFWGHRCAMCGVTAARGRTCERESCGLPLHPQWPAVYCSNACALRDAR